MSGSRWHRYARVPVLAGAVGVLVAACGGSSSDTSSQSSASPASTTSSAVALGAPLAGPGSPAPAVDAGGPYLSDTGFRSDKNGLPFPNYGTGPSLTDADVRTIYGDAVCASTAGGTCLLTEQAKAWQEATNKSMAGGHCYGFSVAALEMWKGQNKPADFSATDVATLSMQSPGLTSRISVDWVYQMFPSVRGARIVGTPNEVLDKLLAYLQSGQAAAETYTIAIYSEKGGHAVTPYAAVDKGNGIVGVLAYDNNFPGTVREVLFDKNANTFAYNSAANPSEPPEVYSKAIALFPTVPGRGVQPCPFCGTPAGGPTALAPIGISLAAAHVAATTAAGGKDYQIFLEGNPADHGHLVFTDAAGHHTGLVGGKVLGEVADVTPVDTLADQFSQASEPMYTVPVGVPLSITIDGTGMTASDTETLTIVGPGMDAKVQDIKLDPGQQDAVTLSADGSALGYKTSKSESPILQLARQDAGADWGADIAVHSGSGGSTIIATLTDQGLGIGGTDDTAATYDLQLTREDTASQQVFKHSGITLGNGDVAALDYTKFVKHGDSIPASITAGGATQQQTLSDQG